MNSEIIFKSAATLMKTTGLPCLVALSLCLSANLPGVAEATSKKTDKSAQASTEKSDKKDDKKDDKSEKKEDKAEKKDAKSEKKDAKSTDKKETTATKPEPIIENVVSVAPEDLVDKPHEYLGKNVKFTAPFFAFTNLALDYKPAMRPAKTHLSLLVARSKGNKKIPLSELKLAMMTPGEKDPETTLLAGLKEGDTLEITGKVFSTALDDPWVDILRLKKIGGAPDDKKADASGKAKVNDTKSSDSKADKANGGKSDTDSKTPGKN